MSAPRSLAGLLALPLLALLHSPQDPVQGSPLGKGPAWRGPVTPTGAWVEPLRSVDAPEARDFVRMYDATSRAPDTAGLAMRVEGS